MMMFIEQKLWTEQQKPQIRGSGRSEASEVLLLEPTIADLLEEAGSTEWSGRDCKSWNFKTGKIIQFYDESCYN